MHPSRRDALLMAAGVAASACGAHRVGPVEVHSSPPSELPSGLTLVPAVLLDEEQMSIAPAGMAIAARDTGIALLETPESADPAAREAMLDVFYANLFVGKIWHAGGYDHLVETGNQVRSIALTFSQQAEFAAHARRWADEAFAALLTSSGVSWQPYAGKLGAALRPPARTTRRGSRPLDGEDNQNLPDYTLGPVPLDPAALPPDLGPGAVLQPTVVHYYAHNGGWFVGQTLGCSAGARLRVLWVLYDRQTGAVLGWADHAARHAEPYFYNPNDSQLQDYLLAVEAEARSSLERAFLS